MAHADKIGVNVYVTQWGTFEIPEDIFKKTLFATTTITTESFDDDGLETLTVTEPAMIPENWRFMKWLDEQEISAGKEPCRK